MELFKKFLRIFIVIVFAIFSAVALPSQIEYEEVIDNRIVNIFVNEL
jgi:hypothetical protein